ncbi:microsomal glutathione S-transferase 1 [Salvelinus sp. IW2-2015]|uniref:microsomal glutathione S-transferase 1 n=1 Tax=Salvelinus sp. IW2-2015 TaxID=2691554 RepID=UPI0038D4FEEE
MAELTHMIDSEVFLAFSTYATIVVLKMMLMSPMTGYFRLTRKVHKPKVWNVQYTQNNLKRVSLHFTAVS